MPNFSESLKSEITRLARKEVRAALEPVLKASASHRRDIAALKRTNDSLTKEVSALREELGVLRRHIHSAKASTQVSAKGNSESATASATKGGRRLGITSKGVKNLRERLGFSVEDFARLVGVSGVTIYSWEGEKSAPRQSALDTLIEIRTMTKKTLAARLAVLKKRSK